MKSIALLPMLLLGCVTDPGEVEELAQTASAVSFNQHGYFYSEDGTQQITSAGVWTSTCFLRGVQGSFDGPYYYKGSPKVGVYPNYSTGKWEVRFTTPPTALDALQAQVVCIPYAGARVFGGALFGAAAGQVAQFERRTNRQCFIHEIGAKTAYGFHGWTGDYLNVPNNPPGVRIQEESTSWVLRGWFMQNDQETGSAFASAVCVDVPAGVHEHKVSWFGSGTLSGALDNSNSSQACGLTGIFGDFNADRSVPRVKLHYASDVNDWKFTMGSGTELYATCLE